MEDKPVQLSSSARPVQTDIGPSPKPVMLKAPSIELPKGGGALKGIDEKFRVNASNGTSTFSLPIPMTSGRDGFSPSLSLDYNSGSGNGAFGLGWSVDIPCIQRRTDKQLPQYMDEKESDVYTLTGMEDLIPQLVPDGAGEWVVDAFSTAANEKITRYRPRIEGAYARIERIVSPLIAGAYWKITSPDNAVTIYGRSSQTRIADPGNPLRIFKWLPELSFDDKGNCMLYHYKPEDLDQVGASLAEKNRFNHRSAFTNQYLKRVSFGNHQPYGLSYQVNPYDPSLPKDISFFFDVLFDYGEHDQDKPTIQEVSAWKSRADAFSDYRPGFELRTYRLCRRVLLFHTFIELGDTPCLVQSLDLSFKSTSGLDPAAPAEVTYLVAASTSGYIRNADGSYTRSTLPSIELGYQELAWDNTVRTLAADQVIQAPEGISKRYQWVDLYSEGISGLLSEQANGWFYKSNLGNGLFSHAERIDPKPSLLGLSDQTLLLQDLEANGEKQLVLQQRGMQGFVGLDVEDRWGVFTAFESVPAVSTEDPNLRLFDLDGDGRPELVISEENAFLWYASAGKKGYAPSLIAGKPFDEEYGPALVFAEETQSIFLADMSGDGLTDIVRIRNGEVCYWPNKGYGKFGAKIGMINAPVFDLPDQFNPAYLHLADITGTGATDILYLGRNKATAWINLSGNGWGGAHELGPIPYPHLPNQFDVIDLLGNGTPCLVLSSPLPDSSPLRYIDLLGGKKPHLLMDYRNNMGKEVTLSYLSSTHFYLADRQNGDPWATKLPFPVHCVSKTGISETVTNLFFTSEYTYHHGYYDHAEREFRGFGRVEQTDTETFDDWILNTAANIVDKPFHQEPTLVKTWFYLGAWFNDQRVLAQYKKEYWYNALAKAGVALTIDEAVLPDIVFGDDLSPEEYREASRACKGTVLRQEVFGLDGSAQQPYPFSVSLNNSIIRRVQPKMQNRYASFLVNQSEAVTYYYERAPADPRISHTISLAFNTLGQVTQSVSVVYARKTRPPGLPNEVWAEQTKEHITYGESFFTNDIDTGPAYRLRVCHENIAYELTGLAKTGEIYTPADFAAVVGGKGATIDFEVLPDGTLQKRRLSHTLTKFLKDDLSGPLPAGAQDSLGLGYQSYQLVFTPGLVAFLYGNKVDDALLAQNHYIHLDGDANWWAPSGTAIYPAAAAAKFYRPSGYQDILGNTTQVTYYSDYYLMVGQVTDPLGGVSDVERFNFRLLSGERIKDVNGNFAEVAIDALGFVAGSAILGKGMGTEGDSLTGFQATLTQVQIDQFFADPLTHGPALLQQATSRIVYDFSSIPVRSGSIVRETHVADLHGAASKLQYGFSYSGGMGNTVMQKSQADPGEALQVVHRPDGTAVVTTVDTSKLAPAALRWIGTGRTVFNNKGKPVKQYERYFSTTPAYENEKQLVEIGVSPILFYDVAGRLVRSELPDGTFSKTVINAWQGSVYDANDTVLDSKWYKTIINDLSPGDADYTDWYDNIRIDPVKVANYKDAAQKAALHYNTPHLSYQDALGRTCYEIADNGALGKYAVRVEKDLTGGRTKLFDQQNRLVASGLTTMQGVAAFSTNTEKGQRWVFEDALGRVVTTWDNDDKVFQIEYDALQRPVKTYLTTGQQKRALIHFVVFGETLPGAATINGRGRMLRLFSQAGKDSLDDGYDFKGNPLTSHRRLTVRYDTLIDWSPLASLPTLAAIDAVADPLLEKERFSSFSTFDALNRVTMTTLPEGTVVRPVYNEASIVQQISALIRGLGAPVVFMRGQEYNAKGQRIKTFLGNDTAVDYFYDERSFRSTRILSSTKVGGNLLQDLNYTYDAVGNLTGFFDGAQETLFFNNAVIRPSAGYTYDALYQLIKATGRELAGLTNDKVIDQRDFPSATPIPDATNAAALRNYTEVYTYNELGNLLRWQHIAGGGSWTRNYQYNDASNTNRLTGNSIAGDADGVYSATYQYDKHGNILSMPHLASMAWNFTDQLQQVDLGGGGTAYYVYGGQGERVRKVIEKPGGLVTERIYLGNVEIYRETQAGNTTLERQTLILEGIAQVDTKTIDTADRAGPGAPLYRYQYTNYLGSASLETDENGKIVSYEEYHPFGTTSYRSAESAAQVSLKRYRFSGKERDEETGLYYFGARYYAAWLGRWTSSDPGGFVDGLNMFCYGRNNPIGRKDRTGTQSLPAGVSVLKAQSDTYTGNESFEDLKGEIEKGGGKLDPRITASSLHRFIPNVKQDDGATIRQPGGTWIYIAVTGNPTAAVVRGALSAPRGGGSSAGPVRLGNPGGSVPARGEFGHVAPMKTPRATAQPPAEYGVPGDPKIRLTENEHIIPGAQLKEITKNPATGQSDYAPNYERDATVRVERPTALNKTNDPVTGDNARTRALTGRPLDLNEDLLLPSLANANKAARATGSAVTAENFNRGALGQSGNLFDTMRNNEVLSKLPEQSGGERLIEGGKNAGRSILYTTASNNRFGPAAGEFGRVFIPFFAEAELVGIFAHPFVVGTLGVTSGALPGIAGAVSAAPTSFAAAVTLPALGGAIVGNAVEQEYGLGAAVASAALTGAIIGAFIPIPGLSILAGAAVGAALGVIGFGISKLF